MPLEDANAPNETQSVMLNECRELRLKKKNRQYITRFTAVESDLYYSYGYNNFGFPILPSSEDSLFISPLELRIEPCLELRYEFMDTNPALSFSSIETQTNNQLSMHKSDNPSGPEDEDDTKGIDNIQCPTPRALIADRSPREVRVQTQPPAFFRLWYIGLLACYNSVFNKPN
ncbi:hypothetical protein QR46_0084 [Giardia duodenalis assemblage B]|uniref:Uncharacterized protein n=3 Tax=Giardia intestinalis TaxID=5741 RepID=A0A132P116_GIAIN|nr:Hypothetical protein GL50581_4103 [Giardia intestinalis ATCC 50581]ESU45877.1 Hypothetical protein GSB_8604 [Giardia intestinalis]KWX15943.1 hypothetical protein QR46_0084 [Giardia intestinalis assemblage B]